jgi:hypothetical protein
MAGSNDASPTLFPIVFPIGHAQETLPLTKLPYLSKGQKRKLEDDFGPNADMAVIYGTIDQASSQSLKDAHHFRNVAYHQDTVDGPSIKSTVTLQFLAVARLLSSVKPMVQRGLYDGQEAALRTELDVPEDVLLTLEGLGDFLVRGIQLDRATVTGSYSASITWRVNWLDRSIRRIAEDLSPEPGLVSAADALQLCQLDQPWPSLDECRRSPVAVKPALLKSWTTEADVIARLREPAEALHRFRAVDRPLRELMSAVQTVVNQISMRTTWG